jgi:hypothetical protein
MPWGRFKDEQNVQWPGDASAVMVVAIEEVELAFRDDEDVAELEPIWWISLRRTLQYMSVNKKIFLGLVCSNMRILFVLDNSLSLIYFGHKSGANPSTFAFAATTPAL